MTHGLERRGYVTAGHYTPEVCIEYPSALRQIHHDFALCGADVLEAFTFNGTEANINRHRKGKDRLDPALINTTAIKIVKEVADEYGCLVAGPITYSDAYELDLPTEEKKAAVIADYMTQVKIFKDSNVDFLLAEYIGCIEEAEWAVEAMKKSGLPVAMTMCIGPAGDFKGVPIEECGVRLARTGADIIGVNCRFEPDTLIDTIVLMQKAINKEGLSAHYLIQPCGYRTHDACMKGFPQVPECPFALESRLISRWDAHRFARRAYENGIRFIGGCCGFEPYHIRAMAEELRAERGGKLPKNSRGLYAENLAGYHINDPVRLRANKEYWYNLVPADGRNPEKE
jgi:betaine-homocysteine S-methyltransferase